MPLPTFLMLIAAVIVAGGASIALFHFTGLPLAWVLLGALVGGLAVRGLRWR